MPVKRRPENEMSGELDLSFKHEIPSGGEIRDILKGMIFYVSVSHLFWHYGAHRELLIGNLNSLHYFFAHYQGSSCWKKIKIKKKKTLAPRVTYNWPTNRFCLVEFYKWRQYTNNLKMSFDFPVHCTEIRPPTVQ